MINFAIIDKFRYHSENWAIANFRYHCEIFSILTKFSLCHSKYPDPPALLPASIQPAFLHSPLDISSSRLDEISENPYELGINQHQYEAKLEMMVEVPKTCKNTKNNLETKSVVLNGHARVNRLN